MNRRTGASPVAHGAEEASVGGSQRGRGGQQDGSGSAGHKDLEHSARTSPLSGVPSWEGQRGPVWKVKSRPTN